MASVSLHCAIEIKVSTVLGWNSSKHIVAPSQCQVTDGRLNRSNVCVCELLGEVHLSYDVFIKHAYRLKSRFSSEIVLLMLYMHAGVDACHHGGTISLVQTMEGHKDIVELYQTHPNSCS